MHTQLSLQMKNRFHVQSVTLNITAIEFIYPSTQVNIYYLVLNPTRGPIVTGLIDYVYNNVVV